MCVEFAGAQKIVSEGAKLSLIATVTKLLSRENLVLQHHLFLNLMISTNRFMKGITSNAGQNKLPNLYSPAGSP